MNNAFLIGEKVYLSILERGDLDTMLIWANNPEVTRYTFAGTVPSTLESLIEEFDALRLPGNLTQSSTYFETILFALMDVESNIHIGNVGLFGINWIFRVAELRAVIGRPESFGGGRIHEAYRLLLDYAFNRLNLRRITAGIREDNAASAIALQKVGFKCEGRFREHYERDGRYYDILPYGLLSYDYLQVFGT